MNFRKIILFSSSLFLASALLFGCTQTETDKSEIIEDTLTAHTLTFEVNPPEAGYISGIANQELLPTERSTTVEAVALRCYEFIGWSNGATNAVLRNIKIEEDTVLTAQYKVSYSTPPVLYLTTDDGKGIRSKTDYVPGTLTVTDTDSKYEFSGMVIKLKGRGNASWGWEKKSFTLKLSESTKLCGLGTGKNKNWILISNHCDQTLSRNYISFWLQRQLGGIPWGPDCRNVEVYFNGQYAGCYLLIEKIDINDNKIDINLSGNTEGPFLVEYDNYANDSGPKGVTWFTVSGEPYQIKGEDEYNEERCNWIDDTLTHIYRTLQNHDEDEIRALIDIDSALDSYILEEVTKNIDCGWSSFYLYMADNGMLYIGPGWDFDLALGNDGRLDNGSYEGLYAGRYNGFGQQNVWYLELMQCDWFVELVKVRYKELYDSGLFNDMVEELETVYSFSVDAFENNFERWPIFHQQLNQEPSHIRKLSTTREHMDFLEQWVTDRADWLYDYFCSESE